MVDVFRMGGPFMYLGLLVGVAASLGALAGVGVLIASFVRHVARGLVLGCGGVVFLMVLGLLAVGAVGYGIGISQMEEALAFATPENQEALRAQGELLATYPLKMVACLAIFPGLVALAVLGRGMMPPKDEA